MSKIINSVELKYQNKSACRARQRSQKHGQFKPRLQDLNVGKMLIRLPKNNTLSQQTKQIKLAQPEYDQSRLFVISSFKNPQEDIDHSMRQFRVHKLKRYVSNEDFPDQKTAFASKNRNLMQQNVQTDHVLHIKPSLNHSNLLPYHEFQETINKKGLLNNINSQLRAKYRVMKEQARAAIKNCKQQANSNNMKCIPSQSKKSQKNSKQYPMLMKTGQDLQQIKAESYIVIEYPSNRVVISYRSNNSLQIASLTKIMTFYTVMQVINKKHINIQEEKVVVSSEVNHIGGTSAQLFQGQIYTIQELLYGLMLPSGNDAANQLAFWAASILAETPIDDHKSLQKLFVAEMNKNAKKLDMKNTNFCNPHGLPHQQAKSTASDIAKLSFICMKMEFFRKIVSTKHFKTTIGSGPQARQVQWQNTNKLLRRPGFIGLKTGITVTAGPCLAAGYHFRDKTYISVVLRAPKVSSRFRQTRLILQWCLSKLFTNLNQQQKLQLKKLKRNNRDLDSDNSQDEQVFKYDMKTDNQFKRRCNILNYQM